MSDYDKVWLEIQRERGLREAGGILVSGNWFHTDLVSRIKFLGLKDLARDARAAGQADDYILMRQGQQILWKVVGEERYVPVTVKFAYDVVDAVGDLDMALYAKAIQHKQAMLQATDPLTYNHRTGWPQSYQDFIEAQGGQYVSDSIL